MEKNGASKRLTSSLTKWAPSTLFWKPTDVSAPSSRHPGVQDGKDILCRASPDRRCNTRRRSTCPRGPWSWQTFAPPTYPRRLLGLWHPEETSRKTRLSPRARRRRRRARHAGGRNVSELRPWLPAPDKKRMGKELRRRVLVAPTDQTSESRCSKCFDEQPRRGDPT